jgi:cell division protein FtsI (penicillin-binding protein 3)
MGAEPDDSYGYPPGDPRRDADKADFIKESESLQKLYMEWNS